MIDDATLDRAAAALFAQMAPSVSDDDGRTPVSIAVTIEKADTDVELGVIYGTASTLSRDKQKMRIKDAKELEKGAIRFMQKATKRATNTHGTTIPGAWVASWVDQDAAGNWRWRVGFKPDDVEIAKAAKRGDFVGFSIGGKAKVEKE